MALGAGIGPPQEADKRSIEQKRSAAELYVLERWQRGEERGRR
jgi:hypothetical protein